MRLEHQRYCCFATSGHEACHQASLHFLLYQFDGEEEKRGLVLQLLQIEEPPNLSQLQAELFHLSIYFLSPSFFYRQEERRKLVTTKSKSKFNRRLL